MKKLIYCAAALATALFAGSCQRELLDPAAQGNTVTFTVEIPEVATKAAAVGNDASMIDDLVYAVYKTSSGSVDDALKNWDKNTTFLYAKNYDVNPFNNGSATISLELLNDQNHIVLLWAQHANTWVTGDDATALTNISYPETLSVNAGEADKYAAFSKVKFIAANDKTNSEPIVLTRPFAQINIATLDPTNYNVEIGSEGGTVITVNGAGSAFNVASQSPAGTANVTYTWAGKVSAHPLTVNSQNYDHYLAMGYVFASDAVSVDYTITTTSGHGTITNSILNVPVAKNFRTNIIGNLLTSDVKYNVTLDKVWSTPSEEIVLVNTASGLQAAVDNAVPGVETEIKLDGDIDLNDLAALLATPGTLSTKAGAEPLSKITIPAGKTITLNLNGYSLTGVDETEAGFELILNNGNLSIVNTAENTSKMILKATIDSGTNRYSSVISSAPGSTLYVGSGVEIQHLGGTYMAYGIDILTNGGNGDVNVTIDGATIKSAYRAVRQFLNSDSNKNELLIKRGSKLEGVNKGVFFQDPSKKANNGKLVIEEGANVGTVYLYVTEGSNEWPVEVSIAAGSVVENGVTYKNVPYLYDVVLKDGNWTVESNFSLAAFVEAVIAAEGTYNGNGKTVKILPLSGESDRTNGCLIPDRLQNYGNPEVYYAQYQRFAELQNVSISNVNFVFVPSAITVQGAWNPAGATTTTENINGELQFMNTGSVTLTNCTFDKVAVSPFNATSLTVADCQFDNLMAYAIKDINAATTSVTGTEFNNCNGGFWFNVAPDTLTATDNTFTTVGRRGAIQFSANGDYSNTTLNISGNTVVGDGAFLWQLNPTITEAQLKPVLENNTYNKDFVDGSIIPVDVAMIGDKGYKSLIAAVAAVEDGQTITLVTDETFTESNRTHNSGTWYDGLYYIGDKSFTIDLDGKTITQDGAVNDYLLNFKNAGSKANTITLKNGTIDAGTTAFCAICTSSTQENELTINTENVNIINNMSNGSTIKLRGGAILNVNDGTIITGKNSYLGIECVASTVNIYDGAEIYMNGTSSYNGCLVGACGGGTVNVYGGYGKGVKGGFIAMTSGGTINVSGGEWIANTDGSIGDNSNLYVLTAQSNKNESGFVGGAYINVTGGTFRGGMDAWVLNDPEVEEAKITISGGNFNADPTSYLEDGYEAQKNGEAWTVVKTQPNTEIWYTGDVKLVPTTPEALNANIVSNVWDSKTGQGVITFDAPLTTIGNEAFKRITNTTPSNWMTSISLPKTVTTIGDNAFYQCFSLTSITIPDSVVSIGMNAFASCTAATTVTIGSGVTSIASGAFYELWELKDFICKPTTPPTLADKWVFSSNYKPAKVIVPAGSVDAYKAANFWSSLNIVAE